MAQRQRLKGLSTVTLVTRTHTHIRSALCLLHSILLRAGCNGNKCVTFQYFLELIPHLPSICECLSVYLCICLCKCNFWFMCCLCLLTPFPCFPCTALCVCLTFVRDTWKYFECLRNQNYFRQPTSTTSPRPSLLLSMRPTHTHTRTHSWEKRHAKEMIYLRISRISTSSTVGRLLLIHFSPFGIFGVPCMTNC